MNTTAKTFLLTAALVVMPITVIQFVSNKDTARLEPVVRQSGKHRDRDRQEATRAETGKPFGELSDDDLLDLYHRKGAATALGAAKSQPWPNRDAAVFSVLILVAFDHPQFAAAELKSSGLSAFQKSGVVDAILKSWKDGRQVLEWAENQLTGNLRCQAVADALGILVKSEPDAAFGYFKNLPPCQTRRQAICELFEEWGSHDPETALIRAKELTAEDAQSATGLLLRGWAKTDPTAAAAWVLNRAPENVAWIAGVYESWISISPNQAKLWFDSLPEGDAKRNAFTLTHSAGSTITMPVFSTRRVISDGTWSSKPVSERDGMDLLNWATEETEGARAFVEKNGKDPVSSQLIAQVARAISGKNGPSVAVDWALGLSEENRHREAILGGILIHEWSQKDPEAAAAKLASMPPDQCGKMPVFLVSNWVTEDPAAAADWVAGWKGGHHTTLIEEVVEKWPNQDPIAAYEWLGTLPAGEGRDAGIKTMIRRERDSAPDTLEPWIDLILDPELREKTRRELDDYLKTPRDG